MKIINADKEKVVIEMKRSEFRDIASMFLYAANQYDHFDNAILNISEDNINLIHNSLKNIISELKNK